MMCHSKAAEASKEQPASIPCARAWTEAAGVASMNKICQKPQIPWCGLGGISPIAGMEVGAEVWQENLVTVLPWCSSSGEAH